MTIVIIIRVLLSCVKISISILEFGANTNSNRFVSVRCLCSRSLGSWTIKQKKKKQMLKFTMNKYFVCHKISGYTHFSDGTWKILRGTLVKRVVSQISLAPE